MASSFSHCSSGQRRAASLSIMNTWLLWLLPVLRMTMPSANISPQAKTKGWQNEASGSRGVLGSLRFQVVFWGAKMDRADRGGIAIKFQCSPIDPNKECSMDVNSLCLLGSSRKYASNAELILTWVWSYLWGINIS